MAFFPIKTTTDTPAFAYNFDSIPLNRLNYAHYNGQTLVYCNHPEGMTPTFLKDNGYVMNKATITTKEFLVYVSSTSTCDYKLQLVVKATNKGSSPITITETNSGFNSNNSWNVAIPVYEKFFGSPQRDIPLKSGESKLITLGTVEVRSNFEALNKFSISAPGNVYNVYIEVFAYKSNTNTSSNVVALNPKIEEYSGIADSFYISTNNTIKASDLFVSYYNSIFYGITQKNFSKNPTEHNPITLVQGKLASEDNPKPFNNLGNWGLQYAFSTTLINDTQNSVKFKGYIISNSNSHCAGIQSGGIAKGFFLGPNGTVDNGNRRWNFCETGVVSKQNSITLDYQYMHLSKGNAPCIMQWEAVRV